MAKKELSKFQQFLVSRKFKTFMGYLYGWGASVVMIGALKSLLIKVKESEKVGLKLNI